MWFSCKFRTESQINETPKKVTNITTNHFAVKFSSPLALALASLLFRTDIYDEHL